jgi:hypothetical protein
MATHQLPIVEPLRFHRIHGEQIRLSDNQSRATRDRLNNTLLFTNRPVLSYETIQFLIEEVSTDYYGLIRIGLTTIDPDSFTRETLPKSMPTNEAHQWFVPTPRGSTNIEKNGIIRLKFTTEGDVSICLFNLTDNEIFLFRFMWIIMVSILRNVPLFHR